MTKLVFNVKKIGDPEQDLVNKIQASVEKYARQLLKEDRHIVSIYTSPKYVRQALAYFFRPDVDPVIAPVFQNAPQEFLDDMIYDYEQNLSALHLACSGTNYLIFNAIKNYFPSQLRISTTALHEVAHVVFQEPYAPITNLEGLANEFWSEFNAELLALNTEPEIYPSSILQEYKEFLSLVEKSPDLFYKETSRYRSHAMLMAPLEGEYPTKNKFLKEFKKIKQSIDAHYDKAKVDKLCVFDENIIKELTFEVLLSREKTYEVLCKHLEDPPLIRLYGF